MNRSEQVAKNGSEKATLLARLTKCQSAINPCPSKQPEFGNSGTGTILIY
jgi:hypothetical protein